MKSQILQPFGFRIQMQIALRKYCARIFRILHPLQRCRQVNRKIRIAASGGPPLHRRCRLELVTHAVQHAGQYRRHCQVWTGIGPGHTMLDPPTRAMRRWQPKSDAAVIGAPVARRRHEQAEIAPIGIEVRCEERERIKYAGLHAGDAAASRVSPPLAPKRFLPALSTILACTCSPFRVDRRTASP